ncbi:MAG: hypothetical protein C0501_17585 [Isosphaera sp.]|nr:hypothetical protein [Isosphaera sp.]
MSQTSVARQALEQLQRSVHAHFPPPLRRLRNDPTVDQQVRRSLVEEVMGKWAGEETPEQVAELRAELARAAEEAYDGPDPEAGPLNGLLTQFRTDIEAAAAELGRTIPLRPTFGTLPIGRPNAMAVPIESDTECLVVLQKGLFMFAYLLAKPVASCFPLAPGAGEGSAFSTAPDGWKAQVAADPAIAERFADTVLSTLCDEYSGATASQRYILDRPHAVLATTITTGMELFVVGHEYGHIIAGHVARGKRVAAMVGTVSCEEIVREWDDEFVADMRGLELSVRAMQNQGYDLSLSYAGADFCFSCLEVLGNGVSVLLTGEEGKLPPGSHPPPALRREVLREWVRRAVPGEHAEGPLQLGKAFEEVVRELWDRTKPLLVRAHEQKVPLANLWNPG